MREAAERDLKWQSMEEALRESELRCAQWQHQCQSDKVSISIHTPNGEVLMYYSFTFHCLVGVSTNQTSVDLCSGAPASVRGRIP